MTQKEEADYNPFQYVGKYGVMYLSEHQYYMRARHYDPTIGRFFSEDISLKRGASGKGSMTIRFASDEEVNAFLKALEEAGI